ncbi:unnamed protein product [Rotaria magnacalcarata]|uniref:Uncharacterized protein n=2 Tax=Rotaria magnacalcarata TaxID=392030 RepID=A0A816EGW7_9BILA|nr:unnamed protein product [Rotaria magnacalcarata]CAF1647411.1 unnamed protein product [Rotaria magnacalcarata]CAF1927452.1 unnamed protein product [Rotaria magnacalcarata]CAF3891408.1 unnamed protein product [Rotaria magnacalcarata]CAF3894004.1 unnamed protein product [Rotaria magnacalcarata]
MLNSRKLRARDLGIQFGRIPDKYNAITDIEGVQVGFKTIIQCDSIRTGVTAVFPRGTDLATCQSSCFANWFSLNGNGDMTGTHWLTESGFLSSSVLTTSTDYVGMCRDSIVKWFLMKTNSSSMIDMEDKQLIISGIPVGKEIMRIEVNSSMRESDSGSIIDILATDAPLLPHQLKRLATRIPLGIGKLGDIAAVAAVDTFLPFSTTNVLAANVDNKHNQLSIEP